MEQNSSLEESLRSGSKFQIPVVFILIVAVLFFGFWYTIETGEVGVKMRFGKYDMQEVPPGLHRNSARKSTASGVGGMALGPGALGLDVSFDCFRRNVARRGHEVGPSPHTWKFLEPGEFLP